MYKDYVSIDLDKHGQNSNNSTKIPFEHQIEAFEALNKVFIPGSGKAGSGILVLPTGAGKTFTATRWLSKNIIPEHIKILWLAPSFYLLAQAFHSFYEEARQIPPSRKTLNIRCVSSNPFHAKAASIQSTDDIIIMTVQTAINNLHTTALDESGNVRQTAFRKFIDSCKETGIFVVVDEAHHSPAYGCRKLLIGEEDSALGIKKLVPKSHLLGLTATPTYTDKSKRGWLWKIFEDGIIYEADKNKLLAQNILARPNYSQKPTGKEIQVDDKLYERLEKEHKDLPEYIIEMIANDSQRNNFIVDTYNRDRDLYGKTIIFADRWFQCVYIKEQLIKKGIKADTIYSHIEADPDAYEAKNKRTQTDNQRILEEFKNDKLDVLINVRMLTEGADVPSVQTVFITRQTTSAILMTQMIGRALRGEKAGGSKEANIVIFFDNWKKLIDWANPEDGEVVDSDKERKRGTLPLEYISIRLVEELSRSIESGGDYKIPEFSKIFPVGWFITKVIYSDDNSESMEQFTEFVMVYEHTKPKFDTFIDSIIVCEFPDEWAKEYLDDEWMQPQIEHWLDKYFDCENDDIGQKLRSDLIKVVRHIAQNQSSPPYHRFEERENYDLEKLADKIIDHPPRIQRQYLTKEFSKPGTLWKIFYKSSTRFFAAISATIDNILDRENNDGAEPIDPIIDPLPPIGLTDAERIQIKNRDGNACLSCGASGKGVRLEIDHIVPAFIGGETSLDNSQTLCSICNKVKGIDTINFRNNTTLLRQQKKINFFLRYKDQDVTRVLTRIVNFFYHCKAVYQVNWHQNKNGKYYSTWEISLYAGNNPEWLLQNKSELLRFIHNEMVCKWVQDIDIISPSNTSKKGVEVKKTSGNDRNFTVHP